MLRQEFIFRQRLQSQTTAFDEAHYLFKEGKPLLYTSYDLKLDGGSHYDLSFGEESE
jgi:hypothetical protein